MSKRVNMIAGFLALRGNISGKQKLQYPKDGKGAYESVMNKKNYATNYRTSYVVAKRSSDGLVYFQVRQRSCNHLTAKSKKAMAVLGGTGAIVGAILANKSATLYTNLVGIFEYSVDHGDNRTFRQFLHASISNMLKNKLQTITIANMGGSATIRNPWGTSQTGTAVTISQDIKVKFADQLLISKIDVVVLDGSSNVGPFAMPTGDWGAAIAAGFTYGKFGIDGEDGVLFNGLPLYQNGTQVTDISTIIESPAQPYTTNVPG